MFNEWCGMYMNYLEQINMNWKMLMLYDYVLKELK